DRKIHDIKVHGRRIISHRGDLAIRADISRSMKSLRAFRLGLALPLTCHPPSPGFFWLPRIAYVETHQDVRAKARRGGRQVGVLAARIRVAVRSGRPGLPVRELPGIDSVTDVPD